MARRRRLSVPRVLALLIAALGAAGVLSTVVDLARGLPPFMVPRLEHSQTLESLVRDYPVDFAVVAAYSLLMVVLAIVFFELLRNLYPDAPLESLVGGLFLGGSVLCGLLVGLTALKTSEFALQVVAGSARQEVWYSLEQQIWLHNGIKFLMQLHLVLVAGHTFLIGLGWVVVASGVLRAHRRWRLVGLATLLAGLLAITQVAIRTWLPVYSGGAPLLNPLQGILLKAAMSLGFLASGILAWLLAGDSSRKSATGQLKLGA